MKGYNLAGLGILAITTALYLIDYYIGAVAAPILFVARMAWLAWLAGWAWQRRTLTAWIFASLFIGVEVGYDLPDIAVHLQVLSQIFIRLIKTIIAPLLLATLVVGVAGHSDMKQLGRLGWKSLLYFEVVTTIALFIGLAAINLTEAGEGIRKPGVSPPEGSAPTGKALSGTDMLLHIFPENIVRSVYDNQVLQIVVFSLLLGLALAMLPLEKKRPLLNFFESLSEAMFKFTNLVMYFAPVGVGAAMAYTVGHMGIDVLRNLALLVVTLYGALLVLLIFVLLPIALFFRIPIRRFAQAIAEPVSIAFATTSSDSALPKAMEALERFGVPRRIIAFVLPMGYSFNLDGTTLYLAAASIFVAQAADISLSWDQQLFMMLTLMLTSKGVAAVPRASLVILFGTAASFDLPVWPIYLILGVDELMDMARTSVNVIGNCLATVIIAKSEGELNAENVPPEELIPVPGLVKPTPD